MTKEPLFIRLTESLTVPMACMFERIEVGMNVYLVTGGTKLYIATITEMPLEALETFLDGSLEVTPNPNGVLDIPNAWRAREGARNAFARSMPQANPVKRGRKKSVTPNPPMWAGGTLSTSDLVDEGLASNSPPAKPTHDSYGLPLIDISKILERTKK